MIKKIPKDYFDPSKGTLKLLWEEEWRGLGITQACTPKYLHGVMVGANQKLLKSLGWEHYEVHEPEPHILLFKCVFSKFRSEASADFRNPLRRPINYQPPAVGH